PLDQQIADFERRGVVASFMASPSPLSFHTVHREEDGIVTSFGRMQEGNFWVNAGFMCLRQEIFDYMEDGDELVEQPFQRLVMKRQLAVYRYKGFWQSMDTFKDKIAFDRMEGRDECPWMVWKR